MLHATADFPFTLLKIAVMIQEFEIRNEKLTAKFKRKGAELCSVIDKATGHEFIWQAQEEWTRHAPILFPVVGRLLDYQYLYRGKTYTLPQHGFARDLDFEMLHQSEHSIAFVLSSSENTLVNYPFAFDFIITYTLTAEQLEQKFRVINRGKDDMPVSFGAHPAFNIPTISDFYLEFEQNEEVRSNHLSGPYIDDTLVDVIDGNRIDITDNLFDQDALIFEGLRSSYVTLKHRSKNVQVKVDFADFPYLGIWAKPSAPFVCIEPWQGLADHISHNKKMLEKKGVHILESEKEFISSFTMTFISE